MSVIEDRRKNGGFGGWIHKLARDIMDNPGDKYHVSINRLKNNDDHDAQLEEIKIVFNDKEHPMHHFISLFLMSQLISDIASDAESLSYDQLMDKYRDAYLLDIGITRAEMNHKKEVDKKNGSLGRVESIAETAMVEKEAIRLYHADGNLKELRATLVVTRIHKGLIDFITEKKLKQKDYSPRTMAEWIRAERKKIKNTVEGG